MRKAPFTVAIRASWSPSRLASTEPTECLGPVSVFCALRRRAEMPLSGAPFACLTSLTESIQASRSLLPVSIAPSPKETQAAIVDALRDDGIATVDLRELLGTELWTEALADVEPFVAEQTARLESLGEKPEHKDQVIVRRFEQRGDEPPRFTLDSPWLRIALSDPVLAVVNEYRGLATKLYYADNWFTPPYAGADQRIASQRWHRDPEEEHVVKTFLYLVDVDADGGPFEYVKGSAPGNRYGDVFPYGGKVKNPTDEDLATEVPDDE